MAAADLDELSRSVDRLPVAAILTDLSTRIFLAVNDLAAEVFGALASDLVGDDVLAHIHPDDREAVRTGYRAMAAKVIDGYQVLRRVVTPDGKEQTVSVSGRRLEDPIELYGLWILVPTSEPSPAVEMLMMGASEVVLAVTDHDWQIEYMSADADLLGVHGSELRGFPLLGLVHPSAASEFLSAAARATVDHLGVTLLTRMRGGHGGWADRHCLMVPICEHQPPRLGVVISADPTVAADRAESRLSENVRRAAIEARAAQTLDALPALARLPQGSELSARQTEIVARLAAGQRVADIARSMFLNSSTVRNHLSAIYRKFSVHSQAELLAALLRAASGS